MFILIRLYHLFSQNDTCTFLLLLVRGFVVFSLTVSISTPKSNGKNNQITMSFNKKQEYPIPFFVWNNQNEFTYFIGIKHVTRSMNMNTSMFALRFRVLNFDQSVQNDSKFFRWFFLLKYSYFEFFRCFDFEVFFRSHICDCHTFNSNWIQLKK